MSIIYTVNFVYSDTEYNNKGYQFYNLEINMNDLFNVIFVTI